MARGEMVLSVRSAGRLGLAAFCAFLCVTAVLLAQGGHAAQGAVLPEVGECVKIGSGNPMTGVFKDKNCTKLSKGEDSGGYEFAPMPTAADSFQDPGPPVARSISFHSAGHLLTCGPLFAGGIEGEFTGPQSLLTKWRMVCGEIVGAKHLACWIPGDHGDVETDTSPLRGRLGFIDAAAAKPAVGWLLEGASGAQILETECESGLVRISGTLLLEAAKPDKSSKGLGLDLSVSGGHELPEALEGGEPAALTVSWAGTTESVLATTSKLEIVSPSSTFEIKALP